MRYLGAVWDVASDAWDATGGKVIDVAGDVFDALPVSGPLKDLVNGPLRDFARTSYGKAVLRAIATSVTGGLAAVIGPQLASVAFALPGLMRGDSFDQAWLVEFQWRVEKTAEQLGGDLGKLLGAQVTRALDELGASIGVGNLVTWTAKELADRLGIREDAAALAISLWNRTEIPGRDLYSILDGGLLVPPGFGRFAPGEVRTYVEGRAALAHDVGYARGAYVPGVTPTAVEGRAAAALRVSAGVGFGPSQLPAPAPVAMARPMADTAPSSNKKIGDAVLLATIVAAGGALVWFFVWERGRA